MHHTGDLRRLGRGLEVNDLSRWPDQIEDANERGESLPAQVSFQSHFDSVGFSSAGIGVCWK
jgi:hypothetical protein